VAIPIAAIEHAEAADCIVFVDNEMNWKPVEGKFVGDSVRKATHPN
jgi:hypothetical protein